MILLVISLFSINDLHRSNFPENPLSKYHQSENELEETDAPLRLLKYEFKKMVDPALGTVPVERLRDVELLMTNQAGRGEQVSAFSWSERGPNNIGGRTRGF